MDRFIAAHVIKGGGNNIVYEGSTSVLGGCVDSTLANDWYESNNKYVKYQNFKIDIFGDVMDVVLPIIINYNKEEYIDVTNEYKKIISQYLKSGIISDKRGNILFKILEYFGVCKGDKGVSFFNKTNLEEDVVINYYTSSSETVVGETIFEYDVKDTKDISRYENILLVLKEVQDGYWDVRDHYLVDKVGKQYVEQQYKIGKDMHIVLNRNTKEVISFEQTDTVYNADKDMTGWFIIGPDGSKTRVEEFNPINIVTDGDILTITVVGAYTHMLRSMLDFKPLTWQYKFLMNFNRINFVAGCRRIGKTRMSAYMIERELWKMPNSIKHVQRSVKVLYIAPTDDKTKEVIDYIKTSSEKVRMLKVLDFNKKENRLYLYDERISRGQKIVNVVATCDFASGKGDEPGRGKASDLVIIDEAAFVGENVWLNILPILENEKSTFYGISTIDWNTQRNWFYEQLVETERGFDPEGYGLRVTIDDVDDVLIDSNSRERMKRALKHNPQRYYAELYATFPNMQQVFNTEGFFLLDSIAKHSDQILEYIIGYDPAKRTDFGAYIVGEIKKDYRGKVVCNFIQEGKLQGEYSTVQRDAILNLKNSFNGHKVNLIMDATQVGDVVAEIFGNIVDYKIWYTSKGQRPSIDNYGAWKVPKNSLVHTSQILMERDIVKANIGLKYLMEEMKYFKSFYTNSGNTIYQAEAGHDDVVNAFMLCCFYFGYIYGKIYDISLGFDFNQNRGEGIDRVTGLYDGYMVRKEQIISKNNNKKFYKL